MIQTQAQIDKAKGQELIKEGDIWREVAKRAQETFRVTDEASAEYAANNVRQLRAILKGKEEERKSITSPLLAVKNAVDAVFKPTTEALTRAIDHYRSEIGRFQAEREQERRAVLVQSAEQIAQGTVPTEIIPVPVHVTNTSVRFEWAFEVTDPDAVPRELCSPDPDKIKRAVWYANTDAPPQEIPGVKFFRKERVTVR